MFSRSVSAFLGAVGSLTRYCFRLWVFQKSPLPSRVRVVTFPSQHFVSLFTKPFVKTLADLSGRFMICVWEIPRSLLLLPPPSGTKFSCRFIAQVIGSRSLKQPVRPFPSSINFDTDRSQTINRFRAKHANTPFQLRGGVCLPQDYCAAFTWRQTLSDEMFVDEENGMAHFKSPFRHVNKQLTLNH